MGAATFILVGTRDATKNVSVWGLAADGSGEWTYDTGANTNTIVQDGSGNVYVGGVAYDAGGGLKNVWKLSSSGALVDSVYVSTMASVWQLAIDANYLYVAGTGAYRLDLDLTNEAMITGSGSRYAIGVDSFGNIYVGGGGTPVTLIKYDSSFAYQWLEDTNDKLYSIDFLANQDVIVGTSDGEIRRYAADGSSPNEGDWAHVMMAFGPCCRARIYNDVIYAARHNGSGVGDTFVVLNSSGARQWGDGPTYIADLEDVVFNSSGVPFVVGPLRNNFNIMEVDTVNEELRGIMIADYALGDFKDILLVDSSYEYSPDLSDVEGQWTLNDNAGTPVVLEEAYGRNGTASKNTSAMTTAGKINTALSFVRADNDEVDLGDNAAWELTPSQDKTYAFWCNWSQNGSNNFNVIFHKYYHPTSVGISCVIVRILKYIKTTIWWVDASTTITNTTGLDLDATGWFLVVIRVDRSGQLWISINNGAYTSVQDISAKEADDLSSSQALMLAQGQPINIDWERFEGDLDNFAIWSRILTQEEEALLWNGGSGSEDFGLVTAPTITSHPISQTKSVGDSVTFSVTATGDPAPTYQWKKNGGDIPGATSSSYTIPSVVVADGADYTCVATNAGGSATSNAATLSIRPYISAQSSSMAVSLGAKITLSITAGGHPPVLTYKWYKDGVEVVGKTESTIDVYPTSRVTYKCIVTNGTDPTTSADIVLTITDNPYTWNPFNLTLDSGRAE